MTEKNTDWLADCEAIRALVQRYARAVDTRDFDVLETLFDPDGTVDGLRGSSPVPAYLEGMRQSPAPKASMHVLGEPLIELEPGSDEAKVDIYGVVHQVGEAHQVLGVRYIDRVTRKAGNWVVSHRATQLIWNSQLP